MSETENVTRIEKIRSINDMMDCNGKLMEEIFNDSKMTAAEKMKGFSAGVRNQVALSRDQQNRINMLAKLGIKPNGELKSLAFNPTDND